MKAFVAILLAVLICTGCASPAKQQNAGLISASEQAAETDSLNSGNISQNISIEEILPLQQPVLVTSFGQSPDSMVAREIFTTLGIDFTYDATAAPEAIDDYKCVVIAVGTSVKSLIANGIEPEDELKRCEQFSAALPDDIPVIMLRLGSSQGITEFASGIIDAALLSADIAIVTDSGDEQRNIQKLAEEKGISYHRYSRIRDIDTLLGGLFAQK